MKLPAETPVIEIESIGRLSDGTPMEYYRTVCRTHHSRIHVTTQQTGSELARAGAPQPAARASAKRAKRAKPAGEGSA